MSTGSSTKAIFYALAANFGIALSKGAGAFYTGSGSLLAEAIHSLADCANQLLLLLGLKRSQRPPSEKHPLGYGRTIYFWSFIVALMLFSMGGLFSIYEGIHKIFAKEPLSQPWIGLIILGVAIFLEMGSLLGALKEINKIRARKSLKQWLRESKQAELLVILGEDVAALAGLFIAFIFLSISTINNNPLFDALGSIAIGLVLLIVAFFIGIRIKSLLIGESAEAEVEASIKKIVNEQKEISGVLQLITIQLGMDIMVSLKVRMEKISGLEQAIKIINLLEERLKKEIPAIRFTFVEPDIHIED